MSSGHSNMAWDSMSLAEDDMDEDTVSEVTDDNPGDVPVSSVEGDSDDYAIHEYSGDDSTESSVSPDEDDSEDDTVDEVMDDDSTQASVSPDEDDSEDDTVDEVMDDDSTQASVSPDEDDLEDDTVSEVMDDNTAQAPVSSVEGNSDDHAIHENSGNDSTQASVSPDKDDLEDGTAPFCEDHFRLDYNTFESFIKTMAKHPDTNLHHIKHLEICFDVDNMDEFEEYRVALALQAFHPTMDGTNPHSIKSLRLEIESFIMVTRHHYRLASPANSVHTTKDLKRLIKNILPKAKKETIPFALSSTESCIAKALLGIRGIEEVTIAKDGVIEGNFAQTILGTLTQPPGTSERQSNEPQELFCAPRMYRSGTILSDVYYKRTPQSYAMPENPMATVERLEVADSEDSESKQDLEGTTLQPLGGVTQAEENALVATLQHMAEVRKSQAANEHQGFGTARMRRVRKPKNRPFSSYDEELVEFGWVF